MIFPPLGQLPAGGSVTGRSPPPGPDSPLSVWPTSSAPRRFRSVRQLCPVGDVRRSQRSSAPGSGSAAAAAAASGGGAAVQQLGLVCEAALGLGLGLVFEAALGVSADVTMRNVSERQETPQQQQFSRQ